MYSFQKAIEIASFGGTIEDKFALINFMYRNGFISVNAFENLASYFNIDFSWQN